MCIWITLLSLSSSITLSAQKVILGSVADSMGTILPGATLLLINPADSSVVGYGVSNGRGAFSIPTRRTGQYWLQARLVGYLVENRTVSLPTDTAVNLILRIDPKEIESVRVKGTRRGFKQKGDTLTYDPKAFTTGMEKTLGDLLAKLPGLQVSADGNVTAQGKPVEKILFGGRDLFGNNVSLATKSISADVADSVKVIHGYSEYSVLDGFQSHDKTVVDVGVNESMWNKLIGEVSAGGGYKSVYEGKAKAMYLGKTFMVSLQALANNTGDPLFSYLDYIAMQGGAQRIDGAYSFSIRTDDALYKLINPPFDTYKQRAELGMLNMSYDTGKRFKLNLGIVATSLLSQANARTERVFNTGPLASKMRTSIHDAIDRTGLLFGTFAATYSPSPKASIQYSITSDYTKGNSASTGREIFAGDTTLESSKSATRPFNLSSALSGAFRFGEHLLSVSLAYDRAQELSNVCFHAGSLALPLLLARTNGLYQLGQSRDRMQHMVSGKATLKFRLTSSQLLSVALFNTLTHASLRVAPSGPVALQPRVALFNDPWRASGYLLRNDIAIALAWIRNMGLFRFNIALEGHYLKAWHNLPSSFKDARKWALAPNVELQLHFASMNDIYVHYSETFTPNAFSNFFPGYLIQSMQSLAQRGFASQLYRHERKVSVSYDFFYSPASIGVNASAATSWMKSLDVVYDSYGIAALSYAIDGATSRSTSVNVSYSQTVASFWRLYGSTAWRNEDSYYYVAKERLPYLQHTASGSVSVSSTYNALINGSIDASLHATYYRLGGASTWSRTTEWRATAGLNLKYKGFRAFLESGYSVAPGGFDATRSILLDAELSYVFPYSITLSAVGNNLLNMLNDRYSSETMTALYRIRRLYGTLPGYAMLRLQWKFGEAAAESNLGMSIVKY